MILIGLTGTIGSGKSFALSFFKSKKIKIFSADEKVKKILETKIVKEKYKVKIITALTIGNKNDVEEYKKFESVSEIILFDSRGYEKSVGFNHELLNNVSTKVNKMLAGNIQYIDKLDKYSKITDIIDISGSLETSGEKDISKIKIFLENISKIKNELINFTSLTSFIVSSKSARSSPG